MKRGGKINDWWSSLDDEAKAAHLAKLAEARRNKAAARRRSRIEAIEHGRDGDGGGDPEAHCKFLAFVREYIKLTAGSTGAGSPSTLWCTLCVHVGTVIHISGGPLSCDCVCHRARKALAEYDDARIRFAG